MASLLEEFKAFALKGNVIDIAVGVIIGGAFGKIVSSLVSDVIMPPIGLLTGGVNFNALRWVLQPESQTTAGKTIEAVTLNYGVFLQHLVDFLIVAVAVFTLVRLMNSLQSQLLPFGKQATPPTEATPPTPEETAETKLLSEIRDILNSQSLNNQSLNNRSKTDTTLPAQGANAGHFSASGPAGS